MPSYKPTPALCAPCAPSTRSHSIRWVLALLGTFGLTAFAWAHPTGEPHVHAQAAPWVDGMLALLAVGASSALAARRAGQDQRLRTGALWLTRGCSLGIAVCALVAVL